MSYETLDKIADSYIPLLALMALICVFMPLRGGSSSIRIVAYRALRLLEVIIPVYALMYLDQYLEIWPSVGLDYSTHTALSLVLTCYVSWIHKRVRVTASIFFVGYLLLMLFQKYHTVMDMVVTGIVIAVFTYIVLRRK